MRPHFGTIEQRYQRKVVLLFHCVMEQRFAEERVAG
jgi:hypothetical protein